MPAPGAAVAGGRFRPDSVSAVLLISATVIALILANSGLTAPYFALLHLDVGFNVGAFGVHMNLHHWINDGLMVLFFFVIGLEVRQEFAHGALKDPGRARLALIAGVAGGRRSGRRVPSHRRGLGW